MTKKVKCNCKHKYQDERYGSGVRIANKLGESLILPKYRCTVCGSVHN